MSWKTFKTVKYFIPSYIKDNLETTSSYKLALFDLDQTLINRSNSRNPIYNLKEGDEWVYLGEVIEKFEELKDEGWTIIIVTNQSSYNDIVFNYIDSFRQNILETLEWEPLIFISMAKSKTSDEYRKPEIGIIKMIYSILNITKFSKSKLPDINDPGKIMKLIPHSSKDKSKEKKKGKGKDEDEDEDKSKEKKKGKGKDEDKSEGKDKDKDEGKDEDEDEEKEKGKNKGKDEDEDEEKGKEKEKGKGKEKSEEKEKGKNKDKDKEKGKSKEKGKDKEKGKEEEKGKNKGKEKDEDEGKGKSKDEEKEIGKEKDEEKGKDEGKDEEKGKEKESKLKDAFFCGDAVGEEDEYPAYTWGNADYQFSLNAGYRFIRPIDLFPSNIKEIIKKIIKKDYGIVIMMGIQGSGKSTFAEKLVKKSDGDYTLISKDILKTKPKIKNAVINALKNNEKIIIDGTHPTFESRKEWIDLAEENDVKYCIVWMVKSGHAFNAQRDVKISTIALNIYTKNFQDPRWIDEERSKRNKNVFLVW